MKKKLIHLLMVSVLLGVAACTAAPAGPSASLLISDQPRQTDPQVPEPDRVELAAGNTDFAFALYQRLREQPGNLFYSPYSISQALAMTYAGSRGQTESEMTAALRFSQPQDRLHPAFNALDLELASRAKDPNDPENELFQLNIVNALWGQQDHPFQPEFLDLLAANYGAGLRLLDFQTAPEPSREEINSWVEEQTEQRIKDLLPSGVVTPDTRLVLTNAIYFKAAWMHQFEKGSTRPEPFNLLDGSAVDVPTMHQQETFGYASLDGLTAVELPYEGGELAMLILLPEAGRFPDFEAALTPAQLQTLLDRMQYTEVQLSLPSFTYESSLGLKQPLSDQGMPAAFDPQLADFSGMDGTRDLAIQDVLHKAFVQVDETGTEAAAATAVIVGVTSAPLEPLTVRVDRPFVFLIRDRGTGTVLFVGRVLDPRG